jgi:phosphohistidine swiveling domain-containing protein
VKTSPPRNPADRFFADLVDGPAAGAGLGGKARSLARLAAAGLPTPRGFVVTDALFRALTHDEDGRALAPGAARRALASKDFPAGFAPTLDARLAALGSPRFSVRSSFAQEDQAGQIAAGIYESRIEVAADDVPAALREVLQSALAPGALAYARTHGQTAAAPPVAVLIHAFVAGDAQGGAACWPPADDRDTLAEPIIDVHAGTLTPTARTAIATAARALARRHGGSEIEWVAAGDAVIFVQLRPYAPALPRAPWSGWQALPAGESPRDWTWDAAHNPLPLSATHASLVQLVDARCRIGIRQRVIGGYLFWAPGEPVAGVAPDELAATIDRLTGEIDAGRAALGDHPPLAAALDFFTAQYQALLGPLPPALRAAREDLRAFITAHLRAEAAHLPAELSRLPALLADVESKATIRRRAAADLAAAATAADEARANYLALFGDEAPIWDIACPTHRERPESLVVTNNQLPAPAAAPARAAPSWTALRDRLAAELPPELRARWSQLVTRARQAVASGEDDDWLYARIQAVVRHAILDLGRRLADAGELRAVDDVFGLALDTLLAIERGQAFARGTLQAMADEARAHERRARLDPPPLPAPADAAPSAPSGSRAEVRGHGCGGHAIGKVVLRHGPEGAAPPPDAILLATSLLPTELPLLQVAALVTEAGGPLGHVATQARERGLAAVVGAAGALALLRDGDLAMVDGTTGVVTRIGRAGSA